MFEVMKKVVHMGVDLTIEERNLLTSSINNVIYQRNKMWKVIITQEQRELYKESKNYPLVKKYLTKIEEELKIVFTEIFSLFERYLIPNSNGETKVFYLKLKADYLKYYLGFCNRSSATYNEYKLLTQETYNEAYSLAQQILHSGHQYLLSIALNYSDFQYCTLLSKEKAILIAQNALNGAESYYKINSANDQIDIKIDNNVSLLIQLLKDTLALFENDDH